MAMVDKKMLALGRAGFPIRALIEVTHQCNASCDYCYLRSEQRIPDLCTSAIKEMIDKLDRSGILFLAFSGGELFYRKDILDLLDHAASKNFFGIHLMTNGLLMTDEHCTFLLSRPNIFSTIKFSAFSHDPAINDQYFGVPGALEKILSIGKLLKSGGMDVDVSISLLDINVDNFDETVRFFGREGFRVAIAHNKLIHHNEQCTELRDFGNTDFFKRLLDSAMRNVPVEQRNKRIKTILSQNDLSLCAGRYISIALNPRGDISPCSGFRGICFGNIFDKQPLDQILNSSSEYHLIVSMTKEDLPTCRACEFFSFCHICLGQVYTHYKDFGTPSIQTCNFARTLAAAVETQC